VKTSCRILQIVPRAPGSHDGVGDYALKLAERLASDHGLETAFASAAPSSVSQVANFRIVAPLSAITKGDRKSVPHIILHYVNYGYHERGVPTHLPRFLRSLREASDGALVTIFHELYASAPPWRSAFWLQPMQKSIARAVARLSDSCVVSSETMRDLLRNLAPESNITVHPVVSTLGEPTFASAQFVRRNPHRWSIFGGQHLLQRSLRSFRQRLPFIPETFAPKELFILGGSDNPGIRRELGRIRDLACHYHPAIEARAASDILSSCSFGWMDYFRQRNVSTDIILKSGSFASYCAHGVIPVLSQAGPPIALQGEQMPGPYFIDANDSNLPQSSHRANISADIYDWYRRHGAVEHLARAIATLLKIKS
jgi:hypothetical protein